MLTIRDECNLLDSNNSSNYATLYFHSARGKYSTFYFIVLTLCIMGTFTFDTNYLLMNMPVFTSKTSTILNVLLVLLVFQM